MKHEDIMKERSNRVKDAISKHHYTFDALEKITGIPHSTMQRYVSGTTDKIPVTFYEAIATATSTPVAPAEKCLIIFAMYECQYKAILAQYSHIPILLLC